MYTRKQKHTHTKGHPPTNEHKPTRQTCTACQTYQQHTSTLYIRHILLFYVELYVDLFGVWNTSHVKAKKAVLDETELRRGLDLFKFHQWYNRGFQTPNKDEAISCNSTFKIFENEIKKVLKKIVHRNCHAAIN